jgi:20S proteasome alpha/beta subunit
VSLLEYSDVLNSQDIHISLNEAQLVTVIIGARCSDGVVLVADKKLTDIFDIIPPEFTNKLICSAGFFRVRNSLLNAS